MGNLPQKWKKWDFQTLKRFDMKTKSVIKQETDRKVNKILHELMEEHDGKCTGCDGRKPLDPSHLIRRSLAPNLVTCKKNIKPHCRSCHDIWDSGDVYKMVELYDFFDNMDAIKEMSREQYVILDSKVNNALFSDKYFFDLYYKKLREHDLRKLKNKHGITG